MGLGGGGKSRYVLFMFQKSFTLCPGPIPPELVPLEAESSPPCPLYEAHVSAGFPSPADDHLEQRLDITEVLIRRPSATFYCRSVGQSMEPLLHDGDLLVIDRSINPVAGDLVVATHAGGLTVKRLQHGPKGWVLASENPKYPALPIDPEDGVQVWGVVTWALTACCQR
jgi:DNA polymerase V